MRAVFGYPLPVIKAPWVIARDILLAASHKGIVAINRLDANVTGGVRHRKKSDSNVAARTKAKWQTNKATRVELRQDVGWEARKWGCLKGQWPARGVNVCLAVFLRKDVEANDRDEDERDDHDKGGGGKGLIVESVAVDEVLRVRLDGKEKHKLDRGQRDTHKLIPVLGLRRKVIGYALQPLGHFEPHQQHETEGYQHKGSPAQANVTELLHHKPRNAVQKIGQEPDGEL